jgi:hypothetical protein
LEILYAGDFDAGIEFGAQTKLKVNLAYCDHGPVVRESRFEATKPEGSNL